MDPLNIGAPLHSTDVHRQASDHLVVNAAAPTMLEEDQHLIIPNSASLPNEDDHLIDPSSVGGNSLGSKGYSQKQRNSSLRAQKNSGMKKRQMLQTKNFMNMTMAQMVSDPHHYKVNKSTKFRQGSAMTP